MSSKEINARIAKLARISESVSSLHFEAVHDEENSEWLVRIGIVRVVHSVSEEEAKEIARILNESISAGAIKIISTNANEIKSMIESMISEEKQE
ncbi:MAG: hypothetical protein M0R32_09535 [Candidatus Cloacimonetes bacterium]|jgi:hypothetical protein|nr:hypothetical protein [Candidatus Cloacimonadota bacterium]